MLHRESLFADDKVVWSTMNDDGSYGEVKEFEGVVSIEPEKKTAFYADNKTYFTHTTPETITLTATLDKFTDVDALTKDSGYIETNCKNCGAAVRGHYCEYCGTRYEKPVKFGVYIGGHLYT